MSGAKLCALAVILALSCGCNPGENPPEDAASAKSPEPEAAAMSHDGHSSRNSLDWAGTYSSVIPCADCPGIRMTVTLRADGSFERRMVYLERSVAPQVDAGQFSWNAAGGTVTLQESDGAGQQYKVGENTLTHLDQDGQPITGDMASLYVLHKHVHDPAIEDREWKLTEFRGKPVDTGSASRLPSLRLDAENAVASGNASCNSFSGPYAIKTGNRLRFDDNLAMTMMACPDMSMEQQFLEVLREADNYSIADGVLSLNRARMAPLARFEAAGE